jgi:CO/xanthine dehydrogenase Mo-binding subunit
MEEALQDEVILHPWHGSNLLKKFQIRKGDMATGWAAADVIIEGTYQLPWQEHAYLQPEAGVGYIDDEGRVTVEFGGQWTHEDREQVAHSLGLPEEQVRIIYPAIGGAFGGKEDMSLQIVLGLAAMHLHEQGIDRPVRIIWTREESIFGHHKRHQATVYTKWGATKEGKITAVSADGHMDSGAYTYTSPKVLGNFHLMVTGPYEIPQRPHRQLRHHHQQRARRRLPRLWRATGRFRRRNQMNKLAEALGMDPVEIRLKNVLREGSLLTVQTPPPPGVSMAEVIERCAQRSGLADER